MGGVLSSSDASLKMRGGGGGGMPWHEGDDAHWYVVLYPQVDGAERRQSWLPGDMAVLLGQDLGLNLAELRQWLDHCSHEVDGARRKQKPSRRKGEGQRGMLIASTHGSSFYDSYARVLC